MGESLFLFRLNPLVPCFFIALAPCFYLRLAERVLLAKQCATININHGASHVAVFNQK
jgi:hypothetical protein